jgi:hypothetical protein
VVEKSLKLVLENIVFTLKLLSRTKSVKMVYYTKMFAVVHHVVHVEEFCAVSVLAEQGNAVQTQNGE